MGGRKVEQLVLSGAVPEGLRYGYGSDYGSGDGYGYGDGSGYGYGSGDGYGYGSGDGYGDGDGDGYGDGSGDGSGSYWKATIGGFAARWTEAQRQRLADLQKLGQATIAFWWSDEAGRACNGGRSTTTAEPGLVEEIKGPLKVCSARALHATTLPPKWKGRRLWVVALFGEVQTDEDKLGALKREIIGECV